MKWEFSDKVLLSLLVSERNTNSEPESYPSLTEEPHTIHEESYMPKNVIHTLLLEQTTLLVSKKLIKDRTLNPYCVPNFNAES